MRCTVCGQVHDAPKGASKAEEDEGKKSKKVAVAAKTEKPSKVNQKRFKEEKNTKRRG